MTDRDLLESLRDILAASLTEAERRDGDWRGMSAPYHGAFACVLHLPSVRSDLQRLERMIREHLEATHD